MKKVKSDSAGSSFLERSPGTFKNLKKYENLLRELVHKNIKLQYRGSVLGLFWTCLQPLLTMIVLAFVFSQIFGKNAGVRNYPVYLLTGRLLFDFYSGSTKKSMRSIRANASIIKKVYVPKYFYPISNIISTFITFLVSLIDLVIVIAFYNIFIPEKAIEFTWWLPLSIVPILMLVVLCFGVGMVLSTMGVFFRDIEYLYDVFCLLLFYMTPIVYTVDRLGLGKYSVILKANPLYGILQFFRGCVINGPDFTAWWSSGLKWSVLYSAVFSLVLAGVGLFIFYKKQDKFILHI